MPIVCERGRFHMSLVAEVGTGPQGYGKAEMEASALLRTVFTEERALYLAIHSGRRVWRTF